MSSVTSSAQHSAAPMRQIPSLVAEQNDQTLAAYAAQPALLKEHHGNEATILTGGYAKRQILELIQNAADAILEHQEANPETDTADQIQVTLTQDHLYVANTGAPLSSEGVTALLMSHSSTKRGNQIGRFGIGFKSLLRLQSPIDVITREHGAFRFDPRRCREQLTTTFQRTEVPGMRLGYPLADEDLAADPELAKLSWAETIIRVQVPGSTLADLIRAEIKEVPAEFLLFSAANTTLTLHSGDLPARSLRVTHEPDAIVLHDGPEESRWRLAKREVTLEIESGSPIHNRKTVPLTWAIPLEGKSTDRGYFWAFFPTKTPTFVPGILNAPWIIDSERGALIENEWNRALMREAAALIAQTLPSLATPEDPAKALDAFPRQDSTRDDPAITLVDTLGRLLRDVAVVPDATGALKKPSELHRHPRNNLQLATRWTELADLSWKNRLTHPLCYEGQHRGSRLEWLANKWKTSNPVVSPSPDLRPLTEKEWFATIASPEFDRTKSVLNLAAHFQAECKPDEWTRVHTTLAILPDASGRLSIGHELILLPPGVTNPTDKYRALASQLAEDATLHDCLTKIMQVRVLDDALWKGILTTAHASRPENWNQLWLILASAPMSVGEAFILEHKASLRVLRSDGKWVRPSETLLPGRLVSASDATVNKNYLVDDAFRQTHEVWLEKLGVTDLPEGIEDCTRCRDDFLGRWRHQIYLAYCQHTGTNPQEDYILPRELKMPIGWRLLEGLTGGSNAKLTHHLLTQLASVAPTDWVTIVHSTRPNTYAARQVRHPLTALLFEHGRVQLNQENLRLNNLIGLTTPEILAILSLPTEFNPLIALQNQDPYQDWFEALPRYRKETKKKRDNRDAEYFRTSQEFWDALVRLTVTPDSLKTDALMPLWTNAALDNYCPTALPISEPPLLLSQVYVTTAHELATLARITGRTVVTLNESTLELWRNKGAKALEISPDYRDAAESHQLLNSIFPELTEEIIQHERAVGMPVNELCLMIDAEKKPTPCMLWDGHILLDLQQLHDLSPYERLRVILGECHSTGWLKLPLAEAINRIANNTVMERRAKVAAMPTLAEKLLCAVGNSKQPLLHGLGEDIAKMNEVKYSTPLELAKLALAHHGPVALSAHGKALADAGLHPPERWHGTEAMNFVSTLGFPESFASSATAKRDAEEWISGPIPLGRLHDYQEEVLNGVGDLYASGSGRRRAVVSLPTGGGKTRCTVESAVKHILAGDCPNRTVIWIAQSDELCEQAVQSFRQVWLNVGTRHTDLRIIRLWGGNKNPSPNEPDKPVVLVSTIQTLSGRAYDKSLDWLRHPAMVIFDECHHAITKSYTGALSWLDADSPKGTAKAPKEEPLILGLSATPFRMDDEESKRLAARFDNQWFPRDQKSLHERLIERGMLSKAVCEALESNTALTDLEQKRFEQLCDKGEGLEFDRLLEEINQRLAGDSKRNALLINRIETAEEKSILFFANSVRHAEAISAQLNLKGIAAAAISGETAASARRYFIDRFKSGDLRVLCNHSVLTTGFDAPKVDMVLIARQVFSPVRYMQMAGRGLRGEKNGGTSTCRIVTVVDNLGRFQDRHSFHYCERYFGVSGKSDTP